MKWFAHSGFCPGKHSSRSPCRLLALWKFVKTAGWYAKRPRVCLSKLHHGIDKLFYGAFNLTPKIMWWYAKRPHLWKSMWHEMRRPASNPKDKTGERASAWCNERALNSYAELPGIGANLGQTPLERLFPDVFENSHRIAKECPVVMGGPGHLDLLYGYAEYLQATRVLETGVAYGWSSLAILLSLSKRPPARLVSIDRPYPLLENDGYVGCVVPEELRRNWTLLKCADRNGLPKALKILGGLDLCHYDSDKSYDGRMWAYPLLWKALRPGGVFISDDVGDNLAFRDFVHQVDCSAYILRKKDKGFAGVLVKPGL